MADVTKINSKNAVVHMDAEDLVEHDLLRWLRSTATGVNHRHTMDDVPFERIAAKLFIQKYPSDIVKIAQKIIVRDKTNVDVYLKIADRVSDSMYEKHPTKLVYTKSTIKSTK